MPMYFCFLQFEQKSIGIVKTWKVLLQAIDASDTTIAIVTTTFSNKNICYLYNLQCSFSHNLNS